MRIICWYIWVHRSNQNWLNGTITWIVVGVGAMGELSILPSLIQSLDVLHGLCICRNVVGIVCAKDGIPLVGQLLHLVRIVEVSKPPLFPQPQRCLTNSVADIVLPLAPLPCSISVMVVEVPVQQESDRNLIRVLGPIQLPGGACVGRFFLVVHAEAYILLPSSILQGEVMDITHRVPVGRVVALCVLSAAKGQFAWR